MNKLTQGDLRNILTHLPKDVRNLMKTRAIFLGGGFIREVISGGVVNDIDLFGINIDDISLYASAFTNDRKAREHRTDNAITIITPNRMPVQFITRWTFADPKELMKSFDFTVCQAVLWYDKESESWQSATHNDFYADLAAKRLVYTSPLREEEAGGSIMRIVKFMARGYNIQAPSIAGVVSRLVAAVDFERDDKQDGWLEHVLCGLLREVDPALSVDGLEVLDDHANLEDL
jgi:hypothetical protein